MIETLLILQLRFRAFPAPTSANWTHPDGTVTSSLVTPDPDYGPDALVTHLEVTDVQVADLADYKVSTENTAGPALNIIGFGELHSSLQFENFK